MARLCALGGECSTFDFKLFQEAGKVVFDGPFVAERTASYGHVLDEYPQDVVPQVAAILQGAYKYTAIDAFKAMTDLKAMQHEAQELFSSVDMLVTPTVARPFTLVEMKAEPIKRNGEVGYYTYAVGPLNLCALAVPAPFRNDRLPFGISLVGKAGDDWRLGAVGKRFEEWNELNR